MLKKDSFSRILCILLSVILFVPIISSSCSNNKGDNKNTTENGGNGMDSCSLDHLPESNSDYHLSNGIIEATVSSDGIIRNAFKDKTEYISNTFGKSFSVKFDEKQSNIWKTDPDSKKNTVITDGKTYLVDHDSRSVVLYSVSDHLFGILRKYSLTENCITVETQIYNLSEKGTLISVTPIFLEGITGDRKPLSCAWPYREGKAYKSGVIENASVKNGTKYVSEHYPSPLSMQFVSLYGNGRSVYFGVHDKNAEYKTFTYSVAGDDSSGISCELLPFASAGESEILAPIVISLGNGDWIDGADIYASFLSDAGWSKKGNDFADSFVGVSGWDANTYYNNYITKYVSYAAANVAGTLETSMRWIQERTGFDTMWLTGWHDGGFDTLYPDYRFSKQLGGEKGFIKGIEQVHDLGGKAVLYINAHIADTASDFYKEHGEICSLKKADGGTYAETYPESGTKSTFIAMCPCGEEYCNRLLETVEMLRKDGADGIYFDQISEMQSYLCFDESHGHSTPATAYYEGYSKLLSEATEIMNRYGDNWIFGIEGVCDCYAKWVDIFFSYPDFNLSELTRYTLGTKIIGRTRYNGADESDSMIYSNAFVMGKPFVCHRGYVTTSSRYSNPNLRRFISIYKQYPEVYISGKYVYYNGLSEIPSSLTAGIMVSESGMAAISFLNSKGMGAVNCEIEYSPQDAKVIKAYNAETGENLLLENGKISISVEKGDILSVIAETKK